MDVFTKHIFEDRRLHSRVEQFNDEYRRISLLLWVALFAREFDELERNLLCEHNPGGFITGQHRLALGQMGLPPPPLKRKASERPVVSGDAR